MIQLRDYQIQANENAYDHLYNKGYGGTVVHFATGLGKTATCAAFIHNHYDLHKQRVLFVVHTIDLIVQTYYSFLSYYPEWDVEKYTVFSRPALGMVTGRHNTPDARIVIGTPQTLSSKEGTTDRLDEVLQYGNFDLVVIDECHYAPSRSYLQLCKTLYQAKRLGLTATPMRNDGLALRQPLDKDDKSKGFLFESICIKRNITWGINNGYLCPVRDPLIVETNIALPQGRGGIEERSRAIDVANWTEIVVDAYEEHGDNRLFAYFLPSVEHSIKACEEFNERGIRTFHVDGQGLLTPDGTMLKGKEAFLARRPMYDAMYNGDVQGACNFAVLDTGWDMPPLALIGLARPTDSPVLVSQIIGRGTRLKPKHSPHQDLLVLDYTLKDVKLMLSGTITGHTWDEQRQEMVRDEEAEIETISDGVDLRDLDKELLVDGNGVLVRPGSLFKTKSEAWYYHNGLMVLSLAEDKMVAITTPNYTAATRISEGLNNGQSFLIENPDHREAHDFYKDLIQAYALAAKYTLWFLNKVGYNWNVVKVADADSPELVFDYAAPIVAEYEDIRLSRKQRSWRSYPASEAQIKELQRIKALSKNLDDIVKLSKGEASNLIAATHCQTSVQKAYQEIMRKAGKYGNTSSNLH